MSYLLPIVTDRIGLHSVLFFLHKLFTVFGLKMIEEIQKRGFNQNVRTY